jgi:hypothetical protein
VLLSGNYWLSFQAPGQPDWRWCQSCGALFFAGNKTRGLCPGNPAGHDASGSGNYFLTLDSGPGQQPDWRWCQVCQALFFAGGGSLGVCPANSNGHDGSRSGNYILSLTVD